MSLQPDYRILDFYQISKKLVVACYELTQQVPAEEKTNLAQYIRAASVTAHLHIAQGTFLKKRKKRKKAIKTIQNALLVIRAAVEVLVEVGFVAEEKTTELNDLSGACFAVLDDLKRQK